MKRNRTKSDAESPHVVEKKPKQHNQTNEISTSPFLILAGEIRNLIYGYCVETQEIKLVHRQCPIQFRQYYALTQVCRVIRTEFLPIYRSQNRVWIDVHHGQAEKYLSTIFPMSDDNDTTISYRGDIVLQVSRECELLPTIKSCIRLPNVRCCFTTEKPLILDNGEADDPCTFSDLPGTRSCGASATGNVDLNRLIDPSNSFWIEAVCDGVIAQITLLLRIPYMFLKVTFLDYHALDKEEVSMSVEEQVLRRRACWSAMSERLRESIGGDRTELGLLIRGCLLPA